MIAGAVALVAVIANLTTIRTFLEIRALDISEWLAAFREDVAPGRERNVRIDYFEDPSNGLLALESNDPRHILRYDMGEYLVEKIEQHGQISDDFPSAFVGGSEDFFDSIISMEARIYQGENERGDWLGVGGVFIAVGCRRESLGPNNVNYYRLIVRTDLQQLRLHRSDGQSGVKELMAQPWVDSTAINPGTEKNELYLRCIGNEIVARMNDKTVASVRDDVDGYRRGRLFIGMGENQVQGRVLFDDLVVTVYR